MKICGIYKITDKQNNKSYIGESQDILSRWSEHIANSFNINRKEYNYLLQQQIRKKGVQNFTFEILKYDIYDIDERHKYEKYYINLYDSYNNGYNQNQGFETEKIIKRKAWTEEEIIILKELLEKGYSQKEIGKKLNRTESSINTKVGRLKLTQQKNRWNKEKEFQMLSLRNQGYTQKEVGNILGFSRETIKKRWHDVFSLSEGEWKK